MAQSFRLREEHKLTVFENSILRNIFGPKRDEVAGDWRRLHKEKMHDPYSSNSGVRWAGYVTCMGEKCIQGLAEKPARRRPLGRPRRGWEDNIKMGIQEIG
jgi:hypothetical protein